MPALLPIEQIERLRRKKWTDLNEFAQEMYALLEADLPIVSSTPLTLNQTGDDPVLTVNPNPNPGPNTQDATNITGGGGGGSGVSPAAVDFSDFGTADPAGLTQSLPVVLYGVVMAKLTNAVYQVRCWMGDPAAASPLGDFNVTQDSIDPAEEIPAGTPCRVWCSVGTGFKVGAMRMDVPVFLGPP